MDADEFREAAERIGKVPRPECERCHGDGGYDHHHDPDEGWSCWHTCHECVDETWFLDMATAGPVNVDADGKPV